MEDSSVADLEPTSTFRGSTRSLPRTQADQEGGKTPLLLTTQPRLGRKYGGENHLAHKETCV